MTCKQIFGVWQDDVTGEPCQPAQAQTNTAPSALQQQGIGQDAAGWYRIVFDAANPTGRKVYLSSDQVAAAFAETAQTQLDRFQAYNPATGRMEWFTMGADGQPVSTGVPSTAPPTGGGAASQVAPREGWNPQTNRMEWYSIDASGQWTPTGVPSQQPPPTPRLPTGIENLNQEIIDNRKYANLVRDLGAEAAYRMLGDVITVRNEDGSTQQMQWNATTQHHDVPLGAATPAPPAQRWTDPANGKSYEFNEATRTWDLLPGTGYPTQTVTVNGQTYTVSPATAAQIAQEQAQFGTVSASTQAQIDQDNARLSQEQAQFGQRLAFDAAEASVRLGLDYADLAASIGQGNADRLVRHAQIVGDIQTANALRTFQAATGQKERQQALIGMRAADERARLAETRGLLSDVAASSQNPVDVGRYAALLKAGGRTAISQALQGGQTAVTDQSLAPLAGQLSLLERLRQPSESLFGALAEQSLAQVATPEVGIPLAPTPVQAPPPPFFNFAAQASSQPLAAPSVSPTLGSSPAPALAAPIVPGAATNVVQNDPIAIFRETGQWPSWYRPSDSVLISMGIPVKQGPQTLETANALFGGNWQFPGVAPTPMAAGGQVPAGGMALIGEARGPGDEEIAVMPQGGYVVSRRTQPALFAALMRQNPPMMADGGVVPPIGGMSALSQSFFGALTPQDYARARLFQTGVQQEVLGRSPFFSLAEASPVALSAPGTKQYLVELGEAIARTRGLGGQPFFEEQAANRPLALSPGGFRRTR